MKRGQSWTVDYTVGMLMFIAVISLSATMIADVFDKNTFDNIIQDAGRLSSALVSTGFPDDWVEEDVVRAGLLYDGRLSWRKLRAIQDMDLSTLSVVLPSSYNYAFVLRDTNETVVGFADQCSFGKYPFSQSATPANNSFGIAYYSRTGGIDHLEPWATTQGATLYEDGEIVSLLRNAHQFGLIILEDPLLNNTLNATLSATLLREEFRKAAEYGPTFVLTGMIGTPVLGVNTTTNVTNGTVQAHDEPFFQLEENDEINFTETYTLSFMPEQGGLLGNLDGSSHQQVIVQQGIVTAATWLYEDSLSYYFSSADGEHTSGSWRLLFEEGLERAASRSSVNCTVDLSVDTTDLVKVDRLVAGRGEIYTLSLYVWRSP